VAELVQSVRRELIDVIQLDNRTAPWSQMEASVADPLSLQLAVLRVTDSLHRETSSSSWTAMLRALGGDREILTRFSALRDRFSSLEYQLVSSTAMHQLRTLSQRQGSDWSLLWPQLETLVTSVSGLYEWFHLYQRNAGAVNERTLRDYAESVHGSDGLTTVKAVEMIHQTVCPPLPAEDATNGTSFAEPNCHQGIFATLAKATAQASEQFGDCTLSSSPHQLVYDLYTLLALTEAKGYAMMQFSWMLLRLYGVGNFTVESEMARGDFERRVVEKAQAARSVLSRLPTWTWKCDPSGRNHRENETFIQFTEVLQGYIVNEVDMNHDRTCKDSCSAYSNTQEKGCFDERDFCAKAQRACANGRIYDCGFVEADSTVCLSNSRGRRYDWIQYKSGRVLGHQKTDCDVKGQSLNTVNSWWRWFVHCSYCTCLCDQAGYNSDRYVSLHASLSDVDANYLVTGLRFVKNQRIVHIQIQQAQALPRGMVNASSQDWQFLEPVSIPQYREESLLDGPGYATLRYDERAVDLDDLSAPQGHVITGVRLRKLGGHLNLEARVSPVNFTTGRIDAARSLWLSNDNTPVSETNPRAKHYLYAPDVPTRSPLPSLPDSTTNQYVEFQATSLEKDVSQTTVPFLDAQDVSPQPPTWLTGVGLYHKGLAGYGGYLSFRLATLDVSDHMALFADVDDVVQDASQVAVDTE